MTIQGPYSGSGGGGSNEQNSGIELSGVQQAIVTKTTIEDVDGDFVTVSGLHEGSSGGSGEPSTDVTVVGNTFSAAGRQGVTAEYVNRLLVANNSLTNVSANVFDIEADVVGGNSDNISISGNTVVGTSASGFLLAAFTGTTVDNLSFSNNQMTSSGQMRIAVDAYGLTNATITGNVATGVDSSSSYGRPAIDFEDTADGTSYTGAETNILVANNTIPSSPWNHGNAIEGVATVWAGGDVNNLQVRDNYMPLTYGSGVPTTYNEVLPLWQFVNPPTLYGSPPNGACGNAQGNVGTIYYGTACSGTYTPPTGPTATSLPGDYPSAAVLAPTSGTSLTGSQNLDANGGSSFGVVKVEFHLTGGSLSSALIGTATPTIYGYVATWSTTSVPDGTYALQSYTYDATGDMNESAPVTVIVDNGTQPVTSVASPATGSSVSGSQWLGANATDSGSSITSVQFCITGQGDTCAVVGTASATIYGYLYDWDTTMVPDGSYTLQTIATDASGNSKTSSGISITVTN
jgi:hypothetical protein